MWKFLGLLVLAPLLASCEDGQFSEAKEAVRRQLKDPESANFREIKRCGNSDIIMGEVNAKNSYGAYSGFEAFYFADGVAELGDGGSLTNRCTAAIRASTQAIINSLPANAQAELRNNFENDGLSANPTGTASDYEAIAANVAAEVNAGMKEVGAAAGGSSGAPDVSREEEDRITANYQGD